MTDLILQYATWCDSLPQPLPMLVFMWSLFVAPGVLIALPFIIAEYGPRWR